MPRRRATSPPASPVRLEAQLLAYGPAQSTAIWVVGGAVRDRLLGRARPDLDVALSGAIPFARQFARHARAAFVVLDPERGVARVVAHEDPSDRIDFGELRGDLLADLRARDFTINAIACPLAEWASPAPRYLDPNGGCQDLKAEVIRAVTERALLDDPLRVLRAERFAAALGFSVEPHTRELMIAAAPRLVAVATERILQEWLPLLEAEGAARSVAELAAIGVLGVLLPELPPDAAARLDELAPRLERLQRHSRAAAWLGRPERLALTRFAALLGPDDAPPLGAEVARRMALSRAQRRVLTALRSRVPLVAPDGWRRALAPVAVARGDDAIGALAVSAAREGLDLPEFETALRILVEEVLPVADEKALLSGTDLQERLGLVPGPAFARILDAVRLAQVEGTVTTVDEALVLAASLAERHG